jgi:hypothetical protein
MKTLKQQFRDAALYGREGRSDAVTSVGYLLNSRHAYMIAMAWLDGWNDVDAFHWATDTERRMFFLFLSEAQ